MRKERKGLIETLKGVDSRLESTEKERQMHRMVENQGLEKESRKRGKGREKVRLVAVKLPSALTRSKDLTLRKWDLVKGRTGKGDRLELEPNQNLEET